MSTTYLPDPVVRRKGVAPGHPDITLFDSGLGHHAFLTDGSRIYDLDADTQRAIADALTHGGDDLARELRRFDTGRPPFVEESALEPPGLRSLSLNVAQRCNLACTYCYASGGDFGAAPASMPWDVAEAAVRTLFSATSSGERVHLAFIGGEPLLARKVIVRSVTLADQLAASHGTTVSYSMTTNGTLVTQDDVDFFAEHRFAVTVSLDGVGEAHDELRPMRSGAGSYERILRRLEPLLVRQTEIAVSARVTVTPRNLHLVGTLNGLLAAGFRSVGFSPMLRSPTGTDQVDGDDLEVMLEQMIECGRTFEREVVAGRPYGFANEMDALVQLHRGVHRPYPCGAGAGYLSVAADGALAACHRFIEDPSGAMGHLDHGPDHARRAAFLSDRHVDRQEPCRSCWARYLCGGGCHHEVIHRGRPACDYVRGWLRHCLGAYVRIMEQRPDWFARSVGIS